MRKQNSKGLTNITKPIYADMSSLSKVSEGISKLAKEISASFPPDLIVQISDLASPGGMVVGSELQRIFSVPPAIVAARIETDERGERSNVEIVGVPALVNKRILIVDDVIFSGSTVTTVVDHISKVYSDSELAVACLVKHVASAIGDNLAQRGVKLFFNELTINRKIRFPWGSAEWFGNISVKFGDTVVSVVTSKRPWGYYEEFVKDRECTVRLHVLSPHNRMSLHRHFNREELFVPIDPGITYILDDKEREAVPGDYVFVPRGTWHRVTNCSLVKARILEIAFGTYDQVGDIERKEDDYGRVGHDGSI